jgi:hypothetical protein
MQQLPLRQPGINVQLRRGKVRDFNDASQICSHRFCTVLSGRINRRGTDWHRPSSLAMTDEASTFLLLSFTISDKNVKDIFVDGRVRK